MGNILCSLQCQRPSISSMAQTTKGLNSKMPDSFLQPLKSTVLPPCPPPRPQALKELSPETSMWEIPEGKLFKPTKCLVIVILLSLKIQFGSRMDMFGT